MWNFTIHWLILILLVWRRTGRHGSDSQRHLSIGDRFKQARRHYKCECPLDMMLNVTWWHTFFLSIIPGTSIEVCQLFLISKIRSYTERCFWSDRIVGVVHHQQVSHSTCRFEVWLSGTFSRKSRFHCKSYQCTWSTNRSSNRHWRFAAQRRQQGYHLAWYRLQAGQRW